MHGAAAACLELACDDVVEDGFEVVEEDSIGCAFENESEAPVRVDTGRHSDACSVDGDVGQEEGDGDEHARYHDSESGVDLDEGPEFEAICFLDGGDELPGSEDPPRVAEEGFKRPHAFVHVGA